MASLYRFCTPECGNPLFHQVLLDESVNDASLVNARL